MAQQHQRPNKLPLPSVNVAGKSIADRERKLPCAKGSLSPNPYQWQSKRHKITSPNGCAKMPLIYDAVSAHHINKGTSINDVPRFLAIFDLPTLSYFIRAFFGAILDTPTYPNIVRH